MPVNPIVDGSLETEMLDLARFVEEAEFLQQGGTRGNDRANDAQDDEEISMRRFCEFALLGQHPDTKKQATLTLLSGSADDAPWRTKRDYDSLIGFTYSLPYTRALNLIVQPAPKDSLLTDIHLKRRVPKKDNNGVSDH